MQVLKKVVQIVEYVPEYQRSIEQLILPIQTVEFGVPITREEQPDLMNIAKTFQQGKGNFWVALSNKEVIGTIGVVDIGDRQVALKKMFVRSDFRGKDKGVAADLMDRATSWCAQNDIHTILLGTVDGMQAAHRFYEKNGFIEIPRQKLPSSFPIVSVDTKFYMCDLEKRSS